MLSFLFPLSRPSHTSHTSSTSRSPISPLTSIAPTLLATLLLPACATLPHGDIPERMLTPEPVQEVTRQDPAGEPYYLNYQVGSTALTAAFDDGTHTYAEFEKPVPSDLSCFDDAGNLLGCEAVGYVLAVEGVHKGILLRHGDDALFIAPNPRARAAPPRQLGNTADWASHTQARNRVILKAPLREALQRSAGVSADPALNQAAGLRPQTPVQPDATGKAAREGREDRTGKADGTGNAWTTLPFDAHSAQLNERHPILLALKKHAGQADEARIDLLGTTENGLLAQARLAATQRWLQQQGVPASRIHISQRSTARQAPTKKGPQTGALSAQLRVQLLKNGESLNGV